MSEKYLSDVELGSMVMGFRKKNHSKKIESGTRSEKRSDQNYSKFSDVGDPRQNKIIVKRRSDDLFDRR